MNKNSASSITETVEALVAPVAAEQGVSVWDVEYQKEGGIYGIYILRILLDKDGGISLDDCTAFSHAVDPVLDKADPIESQYFLEVSSAGLTRKLKKESHFAASVGKTVDLKLYRAENGEKNFTGKLISYNNENTVIEINGSERSFDNAAVADVRWSFE